MALGLLRFQDRFVAKWHLLMAGTAIVVVIPIVVFLIGQKYFIEGVTLTGMKT